MRSSSAREHYVFNITAKPPYTAFWSLTPYNATTHFLVNTTNNTYSLGEKLRDLKLIVNPDFVGCMIMHWAGCGTGVGDLSKLSYKSIDNVRMIKNSTAYIAHFENLFDPRWTRANKQQQWMYKKLDRTIDKARLTTDGWRHTPPTPTLLLRYPCYTTPLLSHPYYPTPVTSPLLPYPCYTLFLLLPFSSVSSSFHP